MKKKVFTKPSVVVASFREGIDVIATSGGPKTYEAPTGPGVPETNNIIWDR